MEVKSNVAAFLERVRRIPPWRIDMAIAAGFVLIAFTTGGDVVHRPRDGIAIGLVLAATLPYCLRRRYPLPVLVVSLTAVAVLYIAGYPAGALPSVIAFGAYTVAAYRPAREVLIAAAFMNLTFVVMLAADSPDFGEPELVTSIAVFGATMLAGWSLQSRRLRLMALEREHANAAERAVADERLRIAQELHDVVAHSLGVIAVQSGVGLHVLDTQPDEARRALQHIATTSRSSLAEIRRLLGLVRAGEAGDAYAPAPRLADLRRLAGEVTDAGLAVALQVPADPNGVPPGVELAAYRIVQEALTNALRHASATQACVSVTVEDGEVRIAVADNGAGLGNGRSGGHGLVGMRERVAVYGGTLDVGSAPGGGVRVAATIPYAEPGRR